ncbi:hypothetical protein GW793_02330 [bacterium]|uniref:POTRA domain-containing protein n=2 Tax=Katanobacteria TaxID=422282 RepID=A0A2M7X579_UNCKA|nr:hypothetical protein [bacterium]PIP56383.1 MAG: hypothetical protein COX05_03185 [candidate division WWE3 bacterium CG22_combo_CG10-13_8_21_14_all_39_12]PJA41287.1 MAG: hypothetical protein CO179_00255 [candidate division WWE3 bacterium CG_4_9_14_3_um_filter_39_7]
MRSPQWFRRLKRRNKNTLPKRINVKRFIPTKKLIGYVIGVIALLSIVFVIATGDTFLVKEIIVSPQSEMYVARSEVGILAQKYVPSSIFMYPGNDLEREITAQYPQVKNSTVTRELPGTVKISYEEFVPVLCIHTSDTWYLVSDDGMVFYSYQNIEKLPEIVPVVSIGETQLGSKISVGESIPMSTIEWFLSAATFEWGSVGLTLSEVVMEASGETTRILQTIYLNSENRLVIKISSKQNPSEILQLIEPIFTGSLRSGKTVIELDLRFDRPVVRYS